MATKTKETQEAKVKATKPVDKEQPAEEVQTDYPGQTDAVSDLMKQVGELTWDEKQAFGKRVNEVINQEADKRSVGHDFDAAAYF